MQKIRTSKPNLLTKTFLDHPRTVGESYFGHFAVAFGFCLTLLWMAVAALVHAFIPVLFENTVSEKITSMADALKMRKADL